MNDKRLKNFYQFVDDNQQQRIQIKELVFFDANIKRVNKFIDCQIDNQMISNKIDIKRWCYQFVNILSKKKIELQKLQNRLFIKYVH